MSIREAGLAARRKRKRTVRTVGAVVALVVVAGAVAGVALTRDGKAEETRYATDTATKQTLVVAVAGSGNMVVTKEAAVTPGTSGTVKDLKVAIGDSVGAGATLYTIENDALDSDVTRALGSYRQAQESYQRAKLERLQAQQRLDALEAKPASMPATDDEIEVAEQQLKIAKAGVSSASTNLESARDAYGDAKDALGERTVTAPMSGVVTELTLQEGGSTSGGTSTGSSSSDSAMSGSGSGSGSGSTLVISDLSSMRARVAVNEVDLASIKVGQKVTLTYDALDGLELSGKVVKVSLTGTNSQGVVTYDVDVQPAKVDARVKPGMSVSAAIVTDVRRDVITVANAAVKSSGDVEYVQVLKQGAPTRVTVETGPSSDTRTEVVSGIAEGDTVVTGTVGEDQTGSSGGGFMGGGGGGTRVMMGGPR